MRKLSKVSPEIREQPEFDDLFSASFDRMLVRPSKTLDVEHVIDTLEALDSDHIEVKYPSDAKRCAVRIKGSGVKLVITKNEIRAISDESLSPNELTEAFVETGKELKQLAGTPVLLLT
jgi:hypothetical protein